MGDILQVYIVDKVEANPIDVSMSPSSAQGPRRAHEYVYRSPATLLGPSSTTSRPTSYALSTSSPTLSVVSFSKGESGIEAVLTS